MSGMDFTPTAEQISLHGLGFIQVKLPGNRRLHVWHPDLPRRACYDHSAVHNHRFAFRSTVIVGRQLNLRWSVSACYSDPADAPRPTTHDFISHDGPRSEQGGRLSYVAGEVVAKPGVIEFYDPGDSYIMQQLEYHETPNDGVVVTLMEKLAEGTVHAASLIEKGHTFDQDFDRFQLPADRLWQFVVDGLRGAA